jgi:hypothetical protein
MNLRPALWQLSMTLAVSAAPLAGQQCEAAGPTVTAQPLGERVILWVGVPAYASLVVRLDVDLVRMRADRSLPHVATYRAGRRHRALTLHAESNQSLGYRYRYSYRWAWGDHEARHDDRYVYQLPFDDGGGFRFIQGPDGEFSHGGKHAYDWSMPEGTPVLAAREGVVTGTCDAHWVGGGSRTLLGSGQLRPYHPLGRHHRAVPPPRARRCPREPRRPGRARPAHRPVGKHRLLFRASPPLRGRAPHRGPGARHRAGSIRRAGGPGGSLTALDGGAPTVRALTRSPDTV